MKKTRRTFSMIIAAVLVVVSMLSSALSIYAHDTALSSASLNDYVCQVLPEIVDFHKIETISPDFGVILGNPIPTYSISSDRIIEAEYDVFPLYINGELYALIRRFYAPSGDPIYSCRMDATNILTEPLTSGAFIYTDNELQFLSSDYSIAGKYSLANDMRDTIQFGRIGYEYGTPISMSNSAVMRYSDEGEIEVEYVRNLTAEETPSCCGGLCWAACGASLANTFAGAGYDAISFHDAVNCALYNNDYHTYMIHFLNLEGVFTSTSSSTTNLTYNTLKNYISDDSVALLDLQSQSSDTAHYVIAYGYYTKANGTKHFRYMDPNEGFCTSQFPTSGTVYVAAGSIGYAVHCHLKCW